MSTRKHSALMQTANVYIVNYDGIKKKDLSPPVIIWIMEIIAACEEK